MENSWDRDFFATIVAPKAPLSSRMIISQCDGSLVKKSNASSSHYGSPKPAVKKDVWSPLTKEDIAAYGCRAHETVSSEDDSWLDTVPGVPKEYKSPNHSRDFEDTDSVIFSLAEDAIFSSGEETTKSENKTNVAKVGAELSKNNYTSAFSDMSSDLSDNDSACHSEEPAKESRKYRGRLTNQSAFKSLQLENGGERRIKKEYTPYLQNRLPIFQNSSNTSQAIDEAIKNVFSQTCLSRSNNCARAVEFAYPRAFKVAPSKISVKPSTVTTSAKKDKKMLPDPIDPHRSYSFKAVDGSFNPNDSCDFCYGKSLREACAEGRMPLPRTGRGPWLGHRLRSKSGDVTCPRMYAINCYNCGATGKKAHTFSHCPLMKYR